MEQIKATDELTWLEESEEDADGRTHIRKVTDRLRSCGLGCSKCTSRWCLNSAWFIGGGDEDE